MVDEVEVLVPIRRYCPINRHASRLQLKSTPSKAYAISAKLSLIKGALRSASASKLSIDPITNRHASYFLKHTGSTKRTVPNNEPCLIIGTGE